MSLNVTEMSQVRNITRCNGHVTECNGFHQDITGMSQKITTNHFVSTSARTRHSWIYASTC